MKTDAKILICYNAPVSIFPVYNGKLPDSATEVNDLSEKGFLTELKHIYAALSKYFTQVDSLAVDMDVQKTIDGINSFHPDVIFNFVESVEGITAYEFCIAGLFELLGYYYTGSVPSSLGNCLNKDRTKNILSSFGIRTPSFLSFKPNRRFTKEDINLRYPIILKLLREDASIGISEYSVVQNYTELRKQFKFLAATYKQEIILEEYVKGREINVAILGNEALPVSEINFDGLPKGYPKIVTYDGKWIEDSTYYNHTKPVCPAQLNEKVREKITELAKESFRALNCRDYARVDIRLDSKNNPYVIEVNPNPDLSTDSGFARSAKAGGISHSELLYTIAELALQRKKLYGSKTKAG